jgi:hypothetical protein
MSSGKSAHFSFWQESDKVAGGPKTGIRPSALDGLDFFGDNGPAIR